MSGMISGYEVLRRFSGGPDGEYQPGQVIDITQIRPTNAASLVERRYLRAVAIDFDPDAERDTWRKRLAPFLAIASVADAPAASRLAHVAAEAAELERAAVELETRAAALHAQLTRAQGVIDGATEASDFAEVARAMAEAEIVGRLFAVADAEARLARFRAAEEGAKRDAAWGSVQGACAWLRGRIDDADSSLGHAEHEARWSRNWVSLAGWLGALEPAAA